MDLVMDTSEVKLYRGDCRVVMAALPDSSVDSIVTDPPYELGFMGRGWDSSGIAFDPEVWAQALRVLKPGGHLLAFGGTRTWHRLAVAVEDAGFEIRDSIAWLYGSGFPKSLDVSKAIDKQRDDRDAVLAVTSFMADAAELRDITRAQVDQHMGTSDMGGWWLSRLRHRCSCPTWEQWERLSEFLHLDGSMDAEVWRLNGRKGTPGEAWEQREVVGAGFRVDRGTGAVPYGSGTPDGHYDITTAATEEAKAWEGWGTALKPAFEPVVVARKPFQGTVAANVLAYGTGAINVDACRVEAGDLEELQKNWDRTQSANQGIASTGLAQIDLSDRKPSGRWPANVLLDQHAAARVDEQSGVQKDGVAVKRNRDGKPQGISSWALPGEARPDQGYGGQGGASRFFYVAKAGRDERPKVGDTQHATVKPLTLMRYLVKLVTPPGGTVLEPFAGSGTTLEAAILEGFSCIGIELDEDGTHIPLIMQRLGKPLTPAMF